MTDDSSWLQRNAFLAAAAILPIVVVLFFLAATEIPKWTVEDPAYDPVFVLTLYDRNAATLAVEFKVENGRLMAIVKRSPNPGYTPYQRLYRFHVRSGELEELPVEVPAEIRHKLENAVTIAGEAPPTETFHPDVLDEFEFHTEPVAPDGYEFVGDYFGSRGLFGELFGMGSRRHRLGVTKSGRLVPIVPVEGHRYGYGTANLLGWIGTTQ